MRHGRIGECTSMDCWCIKVGTVPLAKFPHEIDVEILERNRPPENRFQERFFCGAVLSSTRDLEADSEAILSAER